MIHEIPEDIRQYVLFHFYTPFVKAQRESHTLRNLYNYPLIYGSIDYESQLLYKREHVTALLNDYTFDLDTRIKNRLTRIWIFVAILEEMLKLDKEFHFSSALPVLIKGMSIGCMEAFRVAYIYGIDVLYKEDEATVLGCIRKNTPSLKFLKLSVVIMALCFCLDKEVGDDIVLELIKLPKLKDLRRHNGVIDTVRLTQKQMDQIYRIKPDWR